MSIKRIKHVIVLESKETYCLLTCRQTMNGYQWELPETDTGTEGEYPNGPNAALALVSGFVVSANHEAWDSAIGNSYIANKPWVVDGDIDYHGFIMTYPSRVSRPMVLNLSEGDDEIRWVSLKELTCLRIPEPDYRKLQEYIKHTHDELGWWGRIKLTFNKLMDW